MSRDQDEAIVRELNARGIRACLPEEWTPQLALDIVRENRRRRAADGRVQALGRVGARLAKELADDSGVALPDIVMVLLLVSGKLGSLAVVHGLPGPAMAEIMGFAADDLDQQATAASAAPSADADGA